jgi:D-threo-aldose 1-dehydrogenase
MNQVAVPAQIIRRVAIDVALIAGRYTLLDQTAAAELFPLCRARGVSVWAAGVYNSGVLATVEGTGRFDYHPPSRRVTASVRRLGRICADHGVPLKAAALQFPLRHGAVSHLVISARTPSEVLENLTLLETPIPAELWRRLPRPTDGPSSG